MNKFKRGGGKKKIKTISSSFVSAYLSHAFILLVSDMLSWLLLFPDDDELPISDLRCCPSLQWFEMSFDSVQLSFKNNFFRILPVHQWIIEKLLFFSLFNFFVAIKCVSMTEVTFLLLIWIHIFDAFPPARIRLDCQACANALAATINCSLSDVIRIGDPIAYSCRKYPQHIMDRFYISSFFFLHVRNSFAGRRNELCYGTPKEWCNNKEKNSELMWFQGGKAAERRKKSVFINLKLVRNHPFARYYMYVRTHTRIGAYTSTVCFATARTLPHKTCAVE